MLHLVGEGAAGQASKKVLTALAGPLVWWSLKLRLPVCAPARVCTVTHRNAPHACCRSSCAAPACLQYPPGARDRAVAVAVGRMCDTDLASAIAYYRWVDDEVKGGPLLRLWGRGLVTEPPAKLFIIKPAPSLGELNPPL